VTACAFAVPGDLLARTGGYLYDRHLLALLPQFDVQISHLQLSRRFPEPAPADLAETAALFRETPETTTLLVDGLAYGTLPQTLITAAKRKIVALVHHPLALETGLSDFRRAALEHSERLALACADHIVATSATTARLLAGAYNVSPDRITIAIPGTEPARRGGASCEETPERLNLLAIGSIIPRKGYDNFVAALATLGQLDWQADIVGSYALAPTTVASLRDQIVGLGLQTRIFLHGEYEGKRLEKAFDQAHIFVMPSLYEGYGMALCEAMAHGLPLVTTTAGALADTAPDAVAIKVAPGSVDALADGLRHIMSNSTLRCRLAEASWRAGQDLPNWRETAATVARVLNQVGA
jgi:glycosyltransferase involved in cell wall biosynthesis